MNRQELLKIKVLCCFKKFAEEKCTVTTLTKILQEEKYAISRCLSALEKSNLIDKANPRQPKLTVAGSEIAEKLNHKIDLATNRLLREGVDEKNVLNDAIIIASQCSEETWQMIFDNDPIKNFKNSLGEYEKFDGTKLIAGINKVECVVNFMVQKLEASDGEILSIANSCFEHPGQLVIELNKGSVIIKVKKMKKFNERKKVHSIGSIRSIEYDEDGVFMPIKSSGKLYEIPLSGFKFQVQGSGVGCMILGHVVINIKFSIDNGQDITKKAILVLQM